MKRVGRVVEFDERRGLGVVEGSDGARLPFHCTRIADRSRTVAVGAPVHYDVVPGPLGAWEATAVEPSSESSGESG
jgi:cold shock CspA family protein